MNRRVILQILVICAALIPNKVFGQSDLESQLQGKRSFTEIMDMVDKYFAAHPEENDKDAFESPYLHWKRWEWYMSSRLGKDGEFVNIPQRLFDGLREKGRMKSPEERNINSGWTFVGPSTSPLQNEDALYNGIGRVDRIVFHPTNENIYFICTPAGGLWSTLNDGLTWNSLTDNLPSLGISGFVISYANPSIMYLLTGDGDSGSSYGLGYTRQSIGVLKSTDGGISWHQTGEFPSTTEPFLGYKLIQSPENPELLLAATNSGVYRTIDGGDTWVQEVSGVHFDIEFKPQDATRVYSSSIGTFWRSVNSGDTWTSNSTFDFDPADCGSNGGGRIQIAVAPTNVSKVYLFAGPRTGFGQFCGLYLSTDSGASFIRQSNTPNILGAADNGFDFRDQSGYDLAIACRLDLSTSIIIGGLTTWRSIDGGVTWIHATSYNEDGFYPYIHPDIHDLVYNPLNDSLFACNDGGVYQSDDHGVSWRDLSPNIEASMFYHMRGWDGNINKLMGGLQDNGVKYRSANSSAFLHIQGGDGFDVVFDPISGEPAYASVNSSVLRFEDDGATALGATPDEDSIFWKTIAIHNTDPDILLVGTSDIFKTTDAGANYTNEGASGSWSLTSCPSNNARFYSAGGTLPWNGSGGLYFSNDTGDSWTLKSGNAGFPNNSNWDKITDVAVRPNNSSYVWACFGGFDQDYKVVMSINTGDSWTNMSANLPNVPINCLAIDNDNGVYAGTDIGVFYRSPTMTQWMTWSNGLPNTPVTDLVIFDDGITKRIRASTYGRGVWQSNMAETCDASVIVTGGLEGIRHYEASTSISSASVVQGGIGTFVSFQSGNYITLHENFRVIDDSEFLGFISPCGQGGIPSFQGDDESARSNPNASIIPLRRMWDHETGLPYGSIDDLRFTNDRIHVKFSLKKQGRIQLYAARDIQDTLATLLNIALPSGQHETDADLSMLPEGFHYLLLFYEGKLAHFQELDLRKHVTSFPSVDH